MKTHRELFADFYESMFGTPLAELLASGAPCDAAKRLCAQMMRDISGAGGAAATENSVAEV